MTPFRERRAPPASADTPRRRGPGSAGTEISKGGGATVSASVCDALFDGCTASHADTLIDPEPTALGVPEIIADPSSNESPATSDDAWSVQPQVPLPPLHFSVCAYGCPYMPSGSAVVTICTPVVPGGTSCRPSARWRSAP